MILEGHYLETVEGLFFAVKGVKHPDCRIVAYLRYVQDLSGARTFGKTRYKRVYNIPETSEFLKREFPHYLTFIPNKGLNLQSVPFCKIKKIYSPKEKLQDIIKSPESSLNDKTRKFVKILANESNLKMDSFGVSGSQLIDLDAESSDIDLLVYGVETGNKLYQALKHLREKSDFIHAYNSSTVKDVTLARWGGLNVDIKKLMRIEKKKILHGITQETDYFIRLIWQPKNLLNEKYSKPLKKIELITKIKSDNYNVFTPCIYGIREDYSNNDEKNVEISQIISFRGRFTEQAWKGDTVKVRGTLEKVSSYNKQSYRLVLGDDEDYLLPL